MNFIGVDIAWGEKNPSGLCWLSGDTQRAEIREFAWWKPVEEIARWIIQRAEGGCLVAVDGPIICPAGYRECDRQVARDFSRYRAGPYPVNREKARKCIRLAEILHQNGFTTNPEVEAQRPIRAVVEVYPHPAWVRFFHLPRIIPYKRGNRGEKIKNLRRALLLLRRHLPRFSPPLYIPRWHPRFSRLSQQSTKQLKETEDWMDALFCAYIAFHYWYWGKEKWEIYGSEATGYILIPKSA
ncbi:MAG: DUF429 domain-containing protein [bacterium JZ-2024 1]